LDFREAIEVILKHEGGYVNDPVDPGGETNMGISKRAYPDLDIKGLTKQSVREIYYKDYWLKGKCPQVPDELRLIFFDMVVNMGKSRAVKILQKSVSAKGIKTTVDGGIGPQTISNTLKSGLEPERLRSYRVKYYADLVNRKPSLEKYWFGWYRRATQV
jgi:lysozyme family protein